MPWVGLQCLNVVYPDNTHFLGKQLTGLCYLSNIKVLCDVVLDRQNFKFSFPDFLA